MKINGRYVLRRRDGQNYIELSEASQGGMNNTVMLSETAAFLFKELKKSPKSKEELLHLLLSNFDISTVLALNDIDIFVKTLKRNGIIEE